MEHDVTRVPNNGKLIFPLSMTRLGNAQSPQAIYDFLELFEEKIQQISLDVILLYTNDLYLNQDESAVEVRKKTLNQMMAHKTELLNLINKRKKYVPSAFYFLPWDYAILNANGFMAAMGNLIDKLSDVNFKTALESDLQTQGRLINDSNIRFIIEETVVTHLLLQQEVTLPSTLSNDQSWRMILYPGRPIDTLVYCFKNKLLSRSKSLIGEQERFSHVFYNMTDRVLVDLDK